MVGAIVILVLILIILLIIVFGYLYIRKRLSAISSTWFGTSDFLEGLKKQKQELDAEPKNPYGIDNLVLPEISKDFPNMNIDEMKKLAEENILNYLSSVESGNLMISALCTDALKERILNDIANNKDEKITYENIKFHKTAINQYTKNGSICKLILQSALGYVEKNKKESNIKEERYNCEFIYVYDTKGLNGNESISLNCPNCGAPILGLGHKVCPYCKAGLIDLAPKTWKLSDIYKV